MNLLTHSRMSCYRTCPRKHQLRYEIGLVPDTDSVALRIGTAFHLAKEAADLGSDPEAAIEQAGILDPYETALVAAMFTVHQERWEGDALEVLATELAFQLPLRNPATGRPTSSWSFAGVIDRIYRLPDGRLAIQDYKTTTEDIAPGSDYWLRLSLDQQMTLYVIAARELGYDVQTILYDVTVRPLHRPLLATPPERVKLKKDGTPYANTRLVDETPAEYAARVADIMRERPDRFFARHEIPRLDSDLAATASEMWQQQLAIRAAQKSGHWWRNTGACAAPYRCSYLSVCGSELDPNYPPDGYRYETDVHPEITRATAQPLRPEQAGQEV